jgi:hypothetical protein
MSKEVPETVLLKEGEGQVSEVLKTLKDYVIIPKQKWFKIVDLVKSDQNRQENVSEESSGCRTHS